MSEPRVQALEKNTVWQLNWAPERGEEGQSTHHEPRQRRYKGSSLGMMQVLKKWRSGRDSNPRPPA
jgi:hypothetical protein